MTIIIVVNFTSLLLTSKELALTFFGIMFRFRKQIFEKNYLGNFAFYLLKYFEKGTLSPCHIQLPLVMIMKIVLLSQVKLLSTSQRLLFVHQSANQKRILEKYGNEICLLNATYKTTKYSISLFFLVVKTNVDYQIAGVTENLNSP